MFKILAFLAVLGLVVAAAYASAAGLLVGGGALQVGSDVTYCDTNGVTVTGWGLETDEPDAVYYVKIGGIASACVGNDLFVQLYDGTQTKIFNKALGPVTVVSPETKVTFSPVVDPEKIESIKIWIEGSNN
jgi:hypothetical protein